VLQFLFSSKRREKKANSESKEYEICSFYDQLKDGEEYVKKMES
jgi:hypothetical protein